MIPELTDIGLSEKEAKVYLAALELGAATADQLSKHAKIVFCPIYCANSKARASDRWCGSSRERRG